MGLETRLFDREDPSSEFGGFGFVDLRIGRHGNESPIASTWCTAFLDFQGKHFGCIIVSSVFGSHSLESGTNHRFINRMASHAVFGRGQGGVSECGGLYASEQSSDRGEGDQTVGHGLPFRCKAWRQSCNTLVIT